MIAGKYVECFNVTPCVGVWIEIEYLPNHPMRSAVTPCVGVWIEILLRSSSLRECESHSLRGSVD